MENLSDHLLATFGYPGVDPLDPNTVDKQVDHHDMDRAQIRAAEIYRAKQLLNDVLTRVPPRGTYKLESVLDSIYFFS